MRSRSLLAASLCLAAGLLGACSDTPPPADITPLEALPTEQAPAFHHYVAMGDSYTAAPGVPNTGPAPCHRSDGNYPSLLAEELEVTFVDVSCVGASTRSITGEQNLGGKVVPPQMRAIKPQTDLVTVGIGGNDLTLFADLVGGCGQLGLQRLSLTEEQRKGLSDTPCRDLVEDAGEDDGDVFLQRVERIEERLASTLRRIRAKAPRATIVLVGYPQLIPAKGTCRELPLVRGDYPYVRSITLRLDEAMRRAARKAKVRFLDMMRPSRGHDICAGDDAWVNGVSADVDRAWQFHPYAEEQAEIAHRVLRLLAREGA